MALILVIDDKATVRDNGACTLKKGGYQVLTADDGEAAITLLEEREVDMVLTDLRLKGPDGMAVFGTAKRLWPETEVIVVTGYVTVDTAVEAIQRGAHLYLTKPVKMEEMLALVQNTLETRGLRSDISEQQKRVSARSGADRILGLSVKTQLLRETITQVAQVDCNVLILGEAGTGKGLAARAIHDLSLRADKRFLAFNCGAFTEELSANELFGYEKGAFTDASQTKKGLLELADGGTVFLDEIDELPLPIQVKLLRVLKERAVKRIGGVEEIPLDVRILAATSKNLQKEAEEGAFRLDLFHRLDVLTIRVPSLAERKEDIPLLVSHFLAKHSPSTAVPRLSMEVGQRLQQYTFPGNIQNLENIAQRLLLQADGSPVIEPCHLVDDMQPVTAVPAWPTLAELEKKYILKVLADVKGNKSKAAKILDIDRVSLWRKIKRYGLEDAEG